MLDDFPASPECFPTIKVLFTILQVIGSGFFSERGVKKLAAAVKASAAELKSVRGPFRFGKNNMPVQDYYAFETMRDGGKVATRVVGTPLKAHVDAYAAQCPLN